MLQISLIIFREILEISLLLGIISINAQNIKNYKLYLFLGLFSGVMGALLLAMVMPVLSNSFGGVGSDLFDAFTLFVTTFLLTWMIIFMQGYSSSIKNKINIIGEKVNDNFKHKLLLVSLIAFTTFREGSEIVLFVYSIFIAQKLNLADCILNILLGIIAGAAAGGVIYYGLIKLPLKRIFQVSSILLAFVAASLCSEGFGILNRSGIIELMSQDVWDSSGIIQIDSITGRVLKILVGYNPRPSLLELLSYVLTLGIIVSCVYIYKKKQH